MQQDLIVNSPRVPSIAKPETYQPPVDVFSSVANISYNPSSTPTTFSAKELNRYPTFNPFLDNEEIYAKGQGTLSRGWNSLVKFGGYTGSTFLEGFASIPDTIKGIGGGNMYKNDWAQSLDDWRANLEDLYPNYEGQWEKQHPFLNAIDPFHGNPMNFWGNNLLKNAGFTAGAIGNAVVTDAIVGFATEGIGELPLVANQIGKAALWINKTLSTESKAGQVLRELSPVHKMFDELKEVGVHPEAIKTMANWKAAADMSKLATSTRYGVNLWTASHTEAAIEARDGYNKVKQDLIQKYQTEWGVAPTGEALQEIDDLATSAGNWRYGFNMAVLSVSNMVQWESMLKPFKSLTNKVSEQGEKAFVKDAVEAGIKQKWGTIWNKAIKPSIPSILSEGVWEEGGQFAIEKGVEDYFKNQYGQKDKRKTDDMIHSALEGLKQEFGTSEGWMNILVGSLMGGISHHVGEFKKGRDERKAGILNEEESAKIAAERMKDFSLNGAFENQYDDVAKTVKRQEDMKKAIDDNDIFKYKNLKSGAFFDYIMSSIKANRFDVRLEELRQAKELPEEELKKLLQDEGAERSSSHLYLDKMIENAKEIQKIHSSISSMLKNPYTYRGGAIGNIQKDAERQTNNNNFMAFEKYKSALTNLSYNVRDYKNRTIELNNKLAEINPSLNGNLAMNFTHPDKLQALSKEYGKEAQELQKLLDNKTVSGKEYKDQIKKYLSLEQDIKEFFASNSDEQSKQKLVSLFPKLVNFEINGRGVTNLSHDIPLERVNEAITYGVDLNRLEKAKDFSAKMYNYLMTQEGVETFMKEHEDWSNSMHLGYKPTKEEEVSSSFTFNNQDFSIGRIYTKDGKSPIEILDAPFNNKIKVRNENGEIEYIDINELKDRKLEKTQEEINKEKADKLKKNSTIVKKYSDELQGGEEEVDGETPTEEIIEKKKPLHIITSTGTDVLWSGTTGFNNFHKRHQTFLFNIGRNKEMLADRANYRIIPITKKTEKAFNLEGIIDEDYSDTIRYVYIKINSEDDSFTYLDKDGKAIPMEMANLNDIVFTTAPDEDLSWGEPDNRKDSWVNKLGWSQEQIEVVKQEYKEYRNKVLSLNLKPEEIVSNDQGVMFSISKGHGATTKGANIKNNVLDLGLITKDDLFTPIVNIKTFADISSDNTEEYTYVPKGRIVYNYNGNLFYLNNRNFDKDEAAATAEIIKEIGSKILNGESLNKSHQEYLKGVMRIAKDVSEAKTAKDSIYFDVPNLKLYLNKNVFSIENLNRDLLAMEIEKMYMHISSKKLIDFKKNPHTKFQEYFLDKEGNIDSKIRDSYQHFLLEKREGGKKAPLTTIINIPQGDEIPIVQKYPKLNLNGYFSNFEKPISNKQEKVEKEIKVTKEEEVPNQSKGSSILNKFNKRLNSPISSNVESKSSLQIPKEEPKQDSKPSILQKFNNKLKNSNPSEGIDNEDIFDGLTENEDSPFRTTVNKFTFTGDKKEELEDIKKMLPQVDFTIIKSLISTTNGLKAWGVALPNFVKIAEEAPYGVGYHEAFEQVFNYVLLPHQQLQLVEEFVNRKGSFITLNGETKSFSTATFKEAKEQIADEFGYFRTFNKFQHQSPKVTNFFTRLLNFIKSLVLGNPTTIAEVFSKLSGGQYAKATILSPIKVEEQYRLREFVQDTPEILVQHALTGFTAQMFMNMWKTDAEIVAQLEDSPEYSLNKMFDALYNDMEVWFNSNDKTIDKPTLLKHIGAKANKDSKENLQKYKDLLNNTRGNWNNIKSQWDSYTKELKEFLKTFDFAFDTDDEGNITLASQETILENDVTSRNGSYDTESKTFVNGKNTASKAVKLLFATIADSEFVKETIEGGLKGTVERFTNNVTFKRDDNLLFLPTLASYAKLFNYTMHHACDTNGLQNIIPKLKKQTDKKSIKINANLTTILNRLGWNGSFEGMPESKVKLLLKFEQAFSKQKPKFVTQIVRPDGTSSQVNPVTSDRASQLVESWIGNIQGSKFVNITNKGLSFSKSILDGDMFEFLKKLNIPFTKFHFNRIKNKEAFRNAVELIRKEIAHSYVNKNLPLKLNRSSVVFGKKLEDFAKLYVIEIEGDATESMHSNINNKMTSSFGLNNPLSYIMNDLRDCSTKEEFIQKHPQFKDEYLNNGWVLNNTIFKDGGKNIGSSLKMVIPEGRKTTTGEKRSLDKMTKGERSLFTFNQNLQNQYSAVINADGKIEWSVEMPQFLALDFLTHTDELRTTSLSNYLDIMWEQLAAEINLAKTFENRKFVSNLNIEDKKFNNRPVGKSLRFFKGILSKEFVNEIHALIDGNLEEIDRDRFNTEVTDYINNRAQKTQNIFEKNNILIRKQDADKWTLEAIDSDFLRDVYGKNKTKFTTDEIEHLFFYREAQFIMASIEMHRLFYNDPAQFKDETKRTKLFQSGRGYTHHGTDLNKWLTDNKNKSGKYFLNKNEYGYREYSDEFTAATSRDVITYSQNFEQYKEALGEKKSKKYTQNNIADAQSVVLDVAYQEMLFKSGASWDKQQDDLHQWLMAWGRRDMLENGKLSLENYSEALQKADAKILKNDIPDTVMQILKPIITGVRNENGIAVTFAYKTSTAPLYLYFVKNTPMESTYYEMHNKKIDFVAMSSAHKVGQTNDNIFDFHNIQSLKDVNSVTIPFSSFGIQVETKGAHDKQTQGSQATKIAVQDLMENSVPIDFMENEKDLQKKWNEWKKLSIEEKKKSEIYKAVERHFDALKNLTLERSEKLFKKFDIQKDTFGYTIEDKSKVMDFLLNEFLRRELPINVAQGMKVDEEGNFTNPLEANVNYKKIKEVLWSTIESGLTKPKVNGGPRVLMSVLGRDELKSTEINGKQVIISNGLKFYSTRADGKTNACQIAIPYMFGKRLIKEMNKQREANGVQPFTTELEAHKEAIKYLKTNSGKELLKGIGFRIPTQGLNSIDFFEIVDFLPPQMDCVVFPAEITTKAGSDFDVDKMNMYLKNWYYDVKTNTPKIVPFFGYGEKAKAKIEEFVDGLDNIEDVVDLLEDSQNKYIGTIDDLEKELDKIEKFKSSLYIKSLENEYFSSIENLLSLKQNFSKLISPNDASESEDLAENVGNSRDVEEEQYLNTDYHRLIDSDNMVTTRQLYLDSKQDVGISATGNTNHILSQQGDIQLIIPTKNNFKLRLPFNEISGRANFGAVYDKNGGLISDSLSQTIDGTVDAANNPWLSKLLGQPGMLSTYTFMLRMGVPKEHVGYFLSQPLIQEYMKKMYIQKYMSGILKNVKKESAWDLRDGIIKRIAGVKNLKKMISSKPDQYLLSSKDTPSLKSMIGKSFDVMTVEEKTLQSQILDDFWTIYHSWSKVALNTMMGTNWDTSSMNSPEDVVNKQFSSQLAYQQQGVIGMDNILQNTHLGLLKEKIVNYDEALRTLLNTQKGNAKNVLNNIAIKIKNQFFGKDDFVKYLQKAEASLLDYIVQNSVSKHGVAAEIQRLFLDKDTNVAKWMNEFKKHPNYAQKFDDRLFITNEFLNRVEGIDDVRQEYPSYLTFNEQDADVYTANRITDALLMLKDDASTVVSLPIVRKGATELVYKTMQQFYNDIILSQILQNGSNRTRSSFIHLLPNIDVSAIKTPLLTNMEGNFEKWLHEGMFYKNNWQDGNLVKEAILDLDDNEGKPIVPKLKGGQWRSDLEQKRQNKDVEILTLNYANRTFPFVKITTPVKSEDGSVIGYSSKLYKRIETLDENGITQPIVYPKYHPEIGKVSTVLFKEVNKLGDGNVQEYKDNLLSQFAINPHIWEVSDKMIVAAMEANNVKLKILNLSSLVPEQEFNSEDYISEYETNDVSLPEMQGNSFEQEGEQPIDKEIKERIKKEYPKEIEGIPTSKLLEIKQVFEDNSDADTVKDRRKFKTSNLSDYGMSDKQYKFAKNNEQVLNKLLEKDTKGEALTFEQIVNKMLEENIKFIDTNQLDLFKTQEQPIVEESNDIQEEEGTNEIPNCII